MCIMYQTVCIAPYTHACTSPSQSHCEVGTLLDEKLSESSSVQWLSSTEWSPDLKPGLLDSKSYMFNSSLYCFSLPFKGFTIRFLKFFF